MKTENTCVNCSALECSVRLDCEDNEFPTETQEPKAESEDTNVTVQFVVTKLAEKAFAENSFW
jgi:hypothetical protein